jgi:CheY-like chemotaxis protein
MTQARAIRGAPGQSRATPGEAPTVLVVDDDEAIREVIAEVLRDEGYGVVTASNGLEALEALGRIAHPGLVLLDLMMPVMSGWEFLEHVRESDELRSVPIVVISAMSAPGVSAHLRKPVDLERLLGTVEHFVRRT